MNFINILIYTEYKYIIDQIDTIIHLILILNTLVPWDDIKNLNILSNHYNSLLEWLLHLNCPACTQTKTRLYFNKMSTALWITSFVKKWSRLNYISSYQCLFKIIVLWFKFQYCHPFILNFEPCHTNHLLYKAQIYVMKITEIFARLQ